eukprot:705453-Rhodomonas_salina.2
MAEQHAKYCRTHIAPSRSRRLEGTGRDSRCKQLNACMFLASTTLDAADTTPSSCATNDHRCTHVNRESHSQQFPRVLSKSQVAAALCFGMQA